MAGELIKELKTAMQHAESEQVSITIRVSKQESAAIQDICDYIPCSRQDFLHAIIKRYAIPEWETIKNTEESSIKSIDIEAITESRFFVVNTNKVNDIEDHHFMMKNGYVAAFEDGYKEKIKKLKQGDIIFLYESGVGIVAYGTASGKVLVKDHYGVEGKTFYQELEGFKPLEKPIIAKNIKQILERKITFIQTLIHVIDGDKILGYIKENKI